MNTMKSRIRFSGTLFIMTVSVELRLIMREASCEGESTPLNKRDPFFLILLFEYYPFFFHLFSSYGSDYKC